jgi:hypothetical protein
VVNFDANGARVDVASFVGILAFSLQFGGRPRAKESERVEVPFEIPELSIASKHSFAFRVGTVGGSAVQDRVRNFGSRGHIGAVTSIKDAAEKQKDSALKMRLCAESMPSERFEGSAGKGGDHGGLAHPPVSDCRRVKQ